MGVQKTNGTNRNMQTSVHSCGFTCPETQSALCVCGSLLACVFLSRVCVCVYYVSRESPAALLDPVNNHPTGNSALGSTHTLDIIHSERNKYF